MAYMRSQQIILLLQTTTQFKNWCGNKKSPYFDLSIFSDKNQEMSEGLKGKQLFLICLVMRSSYRVHFPTSDKELLCVNISQIFSIFIYMHFFVVVYVRNEEQIKITK